MKSIEVSLCLFIFIFTAACSNQHDQPHFIGYVVDKSESRVLVVSSSPQDFSDNGGVKEYYDAISLAGVSNEVKIGQLVSVWVDGPIAESYPMQAEASKVEIVDEEKPEGANMKVNEVIQQAIHKVNRMVAIRDVEYNENTEMWNVELVEIIDGSVFEVEILDE